jgi:hypothetical protein
LGGPKFPVRLTTYTSISETLLVYEGNWDSLNDVISLVYEGNWDSLNDVISNTNGKKSV